MRQPTGHRNRWFFTGMALATAATVFVGFARTYYLKGLFSTPDLPVWFHVHGLLFTSWVLLFVVQASLVARGRTSVHRRLGVIGVLLVVPLLVSGVFVAIAAARGQGPMSAAVARGELEMALPVLSPLVGLVIPVTSVVLFAAFATAGVAFRRQAARHKRLMVLAAIAMLPPALGRALATIFGTANPALFFGATVIFLGAIVMHDRRTLGRVHPVSLWGGLFLVASFPGRLALGNSAAWLSFAEWLVQ